MLNSVTPRPEIAARVRSRVRELAAQNSLRKPANPILESLRRLAIPAACAAGGSVLTAFLVAAQLASAPPVSSGSGLIAERTEVNLPGQMLDPDERASAPYILESFVSRDEATDATIRDFAIGDERNDAMVLVNHID